MTQQSKLVQGRRIVIDVTGAHLNPPGGATVPDFTMSPLAPTGLPTTGLLIILVAPSSVPAVAGAGGFAVTPWILNPITGIWGSFATVNINYNEAWVTYDIDAAALFFQIGNVASGTNLYIDCLEQ